MNKYIFIALLCLIPHITFAQGGPPQPPCWPPPCVPVDGGITIFGLIAALFGYRVISKINRSN